MATPEAVIEIGSTGIRLLVAEFTEDRKRNILDRSELPVSLGRDVFTGGTILLDTQIQCVKILSRFREQLSGWGIIPSQTTVIATSAFREAKNRDPVMDRILVKTGFKVKVIDGIEENRLMYLAVTECLKDEAQKVRTEDSMIVEVGGGSTEMLLIRKGKMAGAHSLKLGTVRIEQQMHLLTSSVEDIQRYIEEFIRNTKGSLDSELKLADVQQFIAVGSDATLVAINAGQPISTWLWSIDRIAFDSFVDEIQQYSIEECIARFKISYNEAQTMHVSLLIYKLFIHLTKVKTIIVPETNIRDGLIISKMAAPSEELQSEFKTQIIASAMNLLHKYRGDEKHAEYVRRMSLWIYDTLKDEIALGDRSRLLLEVSAILHDIGMFIRMDDHNLHGSYIIRNSEIFGLSKFENTIIAEIAKYHRGKLLPQDDEQFQMLPRADRMTILKLTAILRIADALDRGHAQRMSDMMLHLENDTFVLQVKERNTVLEKIALTEKAGLFESVFGYKVMLI
jgi:exopolyphosphatase / guanosine-5'-triphosphate,3'-diphosphate pyrophosphatase